MSSAYRRTGPYIALVSFWAFLLVTIAWQGFYCITSTRGDPAGLFFAGDQLPLPPELQGSFQYPRSFGYDGQEYRVIAHDPLGRKQYWKYLDDPQYRSRRILMPALAALFAAGNPGAVDLFYIGLVDVVLAFGAVCFLRLAEEHVSPAAALALFALIPAVVASTDRMVVDGPAVAGFFAALWLFQRGRWRACLVLLTLLPLVRESGLLVSAGVGLAFLMRREYRRVLWTASTALPSFGWFAFCASRTPATTSLSLLSVPVWPQVARLFQPLPRAVSPPLNVLLESLDLAACLCLLGAFFWFAKTVYREFREGGWKEDTLIVFPSVILAGGCVQQPQSWPKRTHS